VSSGPSLFMVLSRPDAVTGWRALMGPTNPEDAKQAQPDWYVTPIIIIIIPVILYCVLV